MALPPGCLYQNVIPPPGCAQDAEQRRGGPGMEAAGAWLGDGAGVEEAIGVGLGGSAGVEEAARAGLGGGAGMEAAGTGIRGDAGVEASCVWLRGDAGLEAADAGFRYGAGVEAAQGPRNRWRRRSSLRVRRGLCGRTSRRTSPAWSSSACSRTWTASASPPCAPQWRAAAREARPLLPPPPPLLALPDGTVYSLPGSKPLRFPGCEGYADACGNWLAFSGEDGCFLRDPFSDATLRLPQMFRVWTRLSSREDMEGAPEQVTVYKMVFCSPQLVATFIRFQRSARVAVCKPGAASWWSVHMADRDSFSLSADMAFHKGKLYVVDISGDSLYTIDVSVDQRTGDPWISRVRRTISSVACLQTMGMGQNMVLKTLYLVESEAHDVLLMVRKRVYGVYGRGKRGPTSSTFVPNGRIELEVFTTDLQQSKYTKVTPIGDNQVLFLRRRCSRFVRVSQDVMPGDRIVFLNNDDEDHEVVEGLGSCSAYDMRDGSVCASAPMVSWQPGSVPATWLYPRYRSEAAIPLRFQLNCFDQC
ncbi:hypothetical protein U9M48_001865 [Paspalum notatum var. saurae]|uniref:KIB1-4 beta-propeller domain-containing protein n=1 Tax=Paspalum notatum var. saurae TaxID=547442 RepID=A0AAQ3SH12_PASNO